MTDYNGVERRRRWRPGDPPGSRRHQIWRDLVPLLALLLALYAVTSSENKVDRAAVDAQIARNSVRSQQAGRVVATGIICGALSGVQDAGRLTITDQLPGTERYRRPRDAQTRRVAAAYARAYNRVISQRIAAQAGADGLRVTRKDGTVDCNKLRVAAVVAPPP